MFKEVQIGLAETGDITSTVWKLTIPNNRIALPLTERVSLAKAKGFDVYEAGMGWSTANQILNVFDEVDKSQLKHVAHIHPSAGDDRKVWPHPAGTDTKAGWVIRNTTSLMIATPFTDISLLTAKKLSQFSGASVGIHWPFVEGMTSDQEHVGARAILQYKFDDIDITQVVHDHPLLGLSSGELDIWLDIDKRRRFAFVSGHDVRNEEYSNEAAILPHVNPVDFAHKTKMVFVKKGWTAEQLRNDLHMVLEAKQGLGEKTIVVANFPGAGTAETADKLHKAVESV
jgi:hypothetical protein